MRTHTVFSALALATITITSCGSDTGIDRFVDDVHTLGLEGSYTDAIEVGASSCHLLNTYAGDIDRAAEDLSSEIGGWPGEHRILLRSAHDNLCPNVKLTG